MPRASASRYRISSSTARSTIPRSSGPGALEAPEVLELAVLERPGGYRHVEDLVVVTDGHLEVLGREVVRHAAGERRPELQRVRPGGLAILDLGLDPPETLGAVPDRRRPG